MYELLMTELHNKPHLVTAARLDAMSAYLMSRQGLDITVPDQPEPMAYVPSETAVWSESGYYIDGGIAIIDMIGTMVHRADSLQAMSGIIGYTTLSSRFKRAMNDMQVHAIFINGDTPGGAVSGAFDFSDLIYSARGIKPVYTLAADCLCSAGILVGSSAEKVFATQTSQIGSIGVVMKHIDISKWNKEIGVNYTYIYAGGHKVDGNPDEPLSKEVAAVFQAEINKIDSMFVSVMDRNTNLAAQEVADMEAGIYLGADAVEAGLAVDVTTADKLLEDMKTKYGAGRPYHSTTTTLETQTMSEKKDEKPKQTAEERGGGAAVETEKPAADAGGGAAVETKKPAASAELSDDKSETQLATDRFAKIMESEAAVGRQKTALHLAKSEMGADAAIAMLKDLPVEAAAPSKLDAAMKGEGGGAGIGAEGEVDAEAAKEQETVNAIAGGISKHMK